MFARILASFLIAVLVFSPVSAAEKPQTKPQTAEHVMTSLYMGCMQAKGDVVYEDMVKTPDDVKGLTESADAWCVAWTVVWFKPLVGYDVELVDDRTLDRFTSFRMGTMRAFGQELALIYNANRQNTTK